MTRPRLSDDPRPERRLACAVLLTAWRDLTGWEPWHQRSALLFFQDAEALAPWCALAGIDAVAVQRQVQAAVQGVDLRPGQLALF
jgi:hypothetical protein